MNRLLLMLLATVNATVFSGEQAGAKNSAFPLWDGHESVADFARRVNLPPTETLDLGNGVKLELVLIPAGKFIMGTPEPEAPKETVWVGQSILASAGALAIGLILAIAIQAIRKRKRPQYSLLYLLGVAFALSFASYGGVRWHKINLAWREYGATKARFDAAWSSDERPAHSVTITKPYYVGKFEVTQAQYQAIMNSNRSHFKGPTNPVEMVLWDDAQDFCKKLGDKSERTVRLLTEAEWEYACRAGTISAYCSGDSDADLDCVAWNDNNSTSSTHAVGQKEANVFGLYDMHGNVYEWCQDWYADEYYAKSSANDPQGPAHGAFRLVRGGSWFGHTSLCRSARRIAGNPDFRDGETGFRIAVVPSFRTPF
jgi:formylglycine-generating enzyme required for sulfatase activity